MDALYSLLAILCTLIFFRFFYFLKTALWKDQSGKVPGMEMRFFDVLGDYKYLPSKSVNKEFDFNTYWLQMASAYSTIFRNEGLFMVWVSYVPFIGFVKAQLVEELISGTKMMEKSFVYSWLHPWLGTGLLTSHGKKWKARRKLLTPAFHFDILKDFLPIFNEQSFILVKNLGKETQEAWTDITVPVTLCTLDIMCESTLGTSVGAQRNSESEYVKAVHRASNLLMARIFHPQYLIEWIFQLSKTGRELKKDIQLLHNFTLSVIAEKKQKLLSLTADTLTSTRKRKALMDLLLEHHIRNQTLSEEDIREEVDTFTFEGHDTTSTGISWALYLIGLYEDVQSKIHEELDEIFGDDTERQVTTDDLKDMKYLDRVLKESQRLYPSVPFFGRNASEEITIGGYKIPKGASCLVITYELHRDPDVFPNPEKFDPDRFLPENSINYHPYAYIPFSAGPRNCIGQRFAVMEVKTVVSAILRNYTLKSLDPRDQLPPRVDIILRNPKPLRIEIRPRRPSTK